MSTPAFTEQSLGKRGSVVITAGAAVEGNFAIIVAGPQGAEVSAITCPNKTNASALETILPAGYTSYGNFTSITLTGATSSIEAYNA